LTKKDSKIEYAETAVGLKKFSFNPLGFGVNKGMELDRFPRGGEIERYIVVDYDALSIYCIRLNNPKVCPSFKKVIKIPEEKCYGFFIG
jgi:hypothetical protein